MAIITISRGAFAGGGALAQCVAGRLGYELLSRELILSAAAKFGVPIGKLATAMEQPPSFWQRLARERTSYTEYVRAVLCEHAREGNLVYHGYAGSLLLSGIPNVLRVRVIADMEFRIRSVMERLNLERNDAIVYIDKADKDRARWVRHLYGVDWNDPCLYDVVLNLARISIPNACEIVARMARMEEFRPTAESLQAVDDIALGSHVRAALNDHPRTSGLDIKLMVHKGIVTISGTALSPTALEAIRTVASGVEGVKEVRCEARTD